MGKASTNKKVARAAATGGGARSGRGGTAGPWKWYAVISLSVVLGVALLVTSRAERQEKISQVGRPRPGDHWHVAYGIHVCGIFQPELPESRNPQGLHTHDDESGGGDGLVHVEPVSTQVSGKNATLGNFLEATQLRVEDGKLTMPDGDVYQDGDKCGGKESVLRIKYNDEVFTENLANTQFKKDLGQMTIFFGPKDAEIPGPPSAPKLDELGTPPEGQPPATEVPIDPSASTVPGAPHTEEPGAPPHTETPPGSTPPPESTPTSGAGTTQAP